MSNNRIFTTESTEDTEKRMTLSHGGALSERVIGLAIDVHRQLGPGLLESAYEECLCFELLQSGIRHERQVAQPILYKGTRLDCGYRMDVVAERELIIEVKSVERLMAIHDAQVLTYLRLSGMKIGLLIILILSC